MSSIKNITDYLENIAPLALQESYDNSGLITGNPESIVNGVMICLDSTEDVIDDAIANNCNLVIAHHPIVFSGIKKLNGKNYVERAIIKAIKNDIAIYAIHTNLDNVIAGVNKIIAEKLGLKNLKILAPKSSLLKKLVTFCPVDFAEKVRTALFHAGAGGIGNYDECSFNITGEGTFRGNEYSKPFIGQIGARHTESESRIETIFESYKRSDVLKALFQSHPYEEVAYDIYPLENSHSQTGSGVVGELTENQSEIDFLKHVKSAMNAGSIRHTSLTGKDVKTVAVCGGSGSFLLNEAIKAGAEIFITADFKYHQFFDADKKIVIADIGHFESEQFTIDLIKTLILEKFSTFAVRLTKVNTNPVYYM
jgi:dinuclear metal center YbgI/SA1388 family protein